MYEIKHTALGTHWLIAIDQPNLPISLSTKITTLINNFENRFSRFKKNTELTKLQHSTFPTKISQDLANMLKLGISLNKLSSNHFNLNITNLLEHYGYDKQLTFKQKNAKAPLIPHNFTLKGKTLYSKFPLRLDLGSLGKGYLIDQIANLLKKNDITHFLIDGGGDIYATTKKDNKPWTIAVEHPLDPNQAIAEISLKNQAIATSSPLRRRLKNFHHLLSAKTKTPQNEFISATVVAKTALLADALSTTLFITSIKHHLTILKEYPTEYLLILPNNTYKKSPSFPTPFTSHPSTKK